MSVSRSRSIVRRVAGSSLSVAAIGLPPPLVAEELDPLPAELAAMTALLDQKYLNDSALAALGFGIAAVLDGRKQYGEAARQLEFANARQAASFARKGQSFSSERNARDVAEMIASFTPEFFESVRRIKELFPAPLFPITP